MAKPETTMAFPSHNDADKQYNWIEHGMHLRDYFAIRIYTKLMELEGKQLMTNGTKNPYDTVYEYRGEIAGDAYDMADAMIERRKEE